MKFVSRVSGALLFAAVFAASSARADDTSEARAHFDAGARLEHDGRFAEAAREYLRADELVQDDEILRAALECAAHPGVSDPELAVALLERSRGRSDPALAALAKTARARASAAIAEVSTTCGACGGCTIAIDGRAVAPGPHFVTAANPHLVETRCVRSASVRCTEPAERSGQRTLREGDVIDPSVPCTPPPPPPPPHPFTPALRRNGLHPIVFFVGVGVTLAAGAGTLISGLDANARHEDFVGKGCDRVGSPGCGALANDGDAAVLRTNVLVALTATLGLSTAILGAFFTGWRLEPEARPAAVALRFGLGTVALGGTF